MVKIVDGFIFYNELQMLSFKLEELYDVLDYFVIVEAKKTFTGKDKELYFQNNKKKYEKYLDKIIHIVVDDLPSKNCWENEKFQRNCIDQGISKLDLNDDDLVIISDCDEIADSNTLLELKKKGLNSVQSLRMHMYYYNVTTKQVDDWCKTKILNYDMYKYNKRNCENIRMRPVSKESMGTINKGGWHFSYFGDIKFIQNKLNHFSHQEWKDIIDINDDEYISKRIENSEDLFLRGHNKFQKILLENNNYLPKNYKLLI